MFQEPDEEVHLWQRGSSKQSSERHRSREELRLALLQELHLRVSALAELWQALEYLESTFSQTENDDVGDAGAP